MFSFDGVVLADLDTSLWVAARGQNVDETRLLKQVEHIKPHSMHSLG
jgi:hypothetical protein